MWTPEPPDIPVLLFAEARQWTESEMACETAAPGEARSIDGYVMYYAMWDRVYEFHTDSGDQVKVCQVYARETFYDQRPEVLLRLDPVAADLAALAIARIAGERDLPQARVRVISARPMVWDDASLGCPVEGEFYALQLVEGYRIVVEAAERLYIFHSNFDRLVLCADGVTATPTFTNTPTPTATPSRTPRPTRTASVTPTARLTRAATRAATARQTPARTRTP
jgi:hypothetical protein